MKLLSEEIDTKVAVLASLSRGSNADDLTRSALENEQVTDTDVMARNGDGIG